jgi:hypothetical protein
MQPQLLELSYLLLPTLWSGLLIGVCFIATPAKFRAPSLTPPVALDVGRATFTVWNEAEWLVLALMVPPLMLLPVDQFSAVATFFLGILLVIQSVVLLPALNVQNTVAKSGKWLAATRLAKAIDHHNYMLVDLIKLCILLAIVWKQGERLLPHLG